MLAEAWWEEVPLLHVVMDRCFGNGTWDSDRFCFADINVGSKSLHPAVAVDVPVRLKWQLNWPGGVGGHEAWWRADPGKVTKHSQSKLICLPLEFSQHPAILISRKTLLREKYGTSRVFHNESMSTFKLNLIYTSTMCSWILILCGFYQL